MTTHEPTTPDPTDDKPSNDSPAATLTADRSDTTDSAGEISDYVDRVRHHLSDIDGEELDDLIHDLELHLREVRAETDQPFTTVIGTPENYAAELRQTAGFGAGPPTTGYDPGRVARLEARVARFFQARLDSLESYTWGRAFVDFLPELRPGWWVARGYLLAVLIGWMTSPSPIGPLGIPSFGGSAVAGLITTPILIVLSVRWGRRRYRGFKKVAVLAAGVIAVLTGLALTGRISDNSNDAMYYEPVGEYWHEPEQDWTILPANIYAYLPDGTPLDEVMLFNEVGDPVDLPEVGFSERLGSTFEAPPVTIDGRGVPNLYPRKLSIPNLDPTSDLDEQPLTGDEPAAELVVPAPTVVPFPDKLDEPDRAETRPEPSTTTSTVENTR